MEKEELSNNRLYKTVHCCFVGFSMGSWLARLFPNSIKIKTNSLLSHRKLILLCYLAYYLRVLYFS